MTGSLHEAQTTFLITSRLLLLRMRNISDKCSGENKKKCSGENKKNVLEKIKNVLEKIKNVLEKIKKIF
jgi:hypothetical protein